MKTINLGSYSITIARDNTGQPAAYVDGSQESSASGEEAILASFLQDARDAGAEDSLYAAIATSQAAVALGKIKSPAKAASSRANGRKGGRPSNLSEFLRGFAETSGETDANAHWAAYSRQLPDDERERVEKGGYDAGRREGLAYRQL